MKIKTKNSAVELTEEDYSFLEKLSQNSNLVRMLSEEVGFLRQVNLTRLAKKFITICRKRGINPKKVSPKFLMAFIDAASYDDADDIQDIWASILAREVEAPGSNSLRTISVLKSLNTDEARCFREMLANAIWAGDKLVLHNNLAGDANKSYDNIIRMEDAGLVVSGSGLLRSRKVIAPHSQSIVAFSYSKKNAILASNDGDAEAVCVISIFPLTMAGADIARVEKNDDGSFLEIARTVCERNKQLTISLHRVSAIKEDGSIDYDTKDLLAS